MQHTINVYILRQMQLEQQRHGKINDSFLFTQLNQVGSILTYHKLLQHSEHQPYCDTATS